MALINQYDIKNNEWFSKLQGNILKGHGRDFTTNIFVKFQENRLESVKEWIADFATTKITSCKKQLKENEIYKRNKVSGGVFYGFMLSAHGYNYLEMKTTSFEKTFNDGMEKAGLNDPEKKLWEEGFQNEIHAMILIGDDNQEKLAEASRIIIDELDLLGLITTVEHGNAIRNENKDGLEHFGYVDGISQPLFFEDELEKYKELNANTNEFNPTAAKELVLVNDPLVKDKDAFGSYFVFRKLEQNVRKFKRNEEKLADVLKLEGDASERAGAMIVGRFEDGTPIEVSDEDGIIASGIFNNFKYSDNNSKCPFHAHIRKSNPRRNGDQKHIMARRGIPYGQVVKPSTVKEDYHELPTKDVGLLFMSFQSSITNQFEFIQKQWVNDENFPNNKNGIDPVIGQNNKGNISLGVFPLEYGETSPSNFTIAPFESAVTMKGGEYFFAPSIPFLEGLFEKCQCL
ncbi:Dyp-type peroxidase [Flavobacterium sp.]|uniref:Dyp-type peroxidase n=1 Tax=Flavobacterium sp. TaxID=239 RepID=UPI003753571C